MQVIVSVSRFNPIDDYGKYWQDYNLEVEDNSTVLDALIKIREEIDGSLAMRCSCRSAICGSCAMRVNGHARLACNTKLADMIDDTGMVKVEPMTNLPLIKDLVIDQQMFWDKVKQVSPWIQSEGPEPKGEYVASNESMNNLAGVMACIMCGACVSDCSALEVDKNFIGPAALAKAYRFVDDPRDSKAVERLGMLNEYGGIWDCTRCYECVEVCPKGVAPMDRIMALREEAIKVGYDDTMGARHADAFSDIVENSGWLDELRLPIKTVGIFNLPALLNFAPVGLRALVKGKMPAIFHHNVPNVQNVRNLFKRIRNDKNNDD